MKTICITHSADFDGIFSQQIAKKFLPDDTTFIGWDFGDAPLPFPDKDTLYYVIDLPMDAPFGLKFKDGWMCYADKSMSREQGRIQPIDRIDFSHWVWIDHHKSSIESHPTEIPGYRIDGVAACRLAWQWFNMRENPAVEVQLLALPTKEQFVARDVYEPYAVRLAGEYDIWCKDDPNADVFQFGLRSVELTEDDWRDLLSMDRKSSVSEVEALMDVGHDKNLPNPDGTMIPAIVWTLLKNGELLMKYQRAIDADVVNYRSFLFGFEGLKFLGLNTARCNSLSFMAKDKPETGHDALCGFYWDGKQWKTSLYHAQHRKDIDLSVIASKYGGGGHRGACGFHSICLPFEFKP